ncbi:ATP-binding protein [Succinimonas sp.]|uniref:ATP-binding protein n=1 Tax=Succinimonas sp. TaxID=1936151 RepID=UPI003869861D
MKFVSRNIRLGACIAGVYREDAFELPMDSIREMITNAVCHRSYLLAGSVQVAICDDRLEVTSPGRLSSDLTIEKMIAGASRIRNVAIGAAFQYMRLVEKWGSGMPGIFQEAKSYGLKPPEIKDFGTSFRISLFRKPMETDVSGVVNPLRTLSAGVIESDTNRPAGIVDFDTDDTNPAAGTADFDTDDTNPSAGTSDSDTDDTNPSIRTSEFDTNPREASLTRNEQAILTILRSDARTTQKAMTEITGLSIATVKRLCAALQKKGIIRSKGSGRKGTWKIL